MAPALSDYVKKIERGLAAGRATEHTHRRALEELVEALDPAVRATNEPTHVECGAPDLLVSRNGVTVGYVETKDVGASLDGEERSEQLQRYRGALSNLVLTDYLEFRWYVDGERRQTVRLGSATRDGRIKRIKGGRQALEELFAKFFAQEPPIIGRPGELAQRMAGLARMIRDTILGALVSEEANDVALSPLHGQMESFRKVLLHDLTSEQFADMYAQTVCYGLFAAKVNSNDGQSFTRQTAPYALPRTNPFMFWLFGHIVGPGMDERIAWAVDDLVALLRCADMVAILEEFGKGTGREDPVVHFYETFLHAYDPVIREMRGVYYTPKPVVSYVVQSVDHLLKEVFHCSDGLADTSMVAAPDGQPKLDTGPWRRDRQAAKTHRVLILDPACGTGTFLHAVVDAINDHVKRKGQEGAWSGYVSDHLLRRLYGFELLMAPYAVAHLKLGMQLSDLGYSFHARERLHVYLTNTLEEPREFAGLPLFAQQLAREVQDANRVKRDLPIMVILGNPPYSGHSANPSWEIKDGKRVRNFIGKLVRDYYRVDGKPLGERNPKWLQDDYVKFIRWAQWRIERTGAGILAFITNHGYLNNPTFRGMRQNLMHTFDDIYILDLHGNAKRRERCPDGSPDENVFDIQQGVAIGVFVRRPGAGERHARVQHAHLWGLREVWKERPSGERVLCGGKYHWLLGHDLAMTDWTPIEPRSPFYLFVPQDTDLLEEYEQGWKVTEVMPVNVLGFQTHRDRFAIDFDRRSLRQRILDMRDTTLRDDDFAERYGLTRQLAWIRKARRAMSHVAQWMQPIARCLYRPFDWRFCYYSPIVMDRPRRELLDHVGGRDNLCALFIRQMQDQMPYSHILASNVPAIDRTFRCSRGAATVFPLYLYPEEGALPGMDEAAGTPGGRRPNLSPEFIAAFKEKLSLSFVPDGKGDLQATFGPEDVFNYIYAVFHSPTYRQRYAEFLKIDFPRVPLTPDGGLFAALVGFGQQLVALHLMESPALDQSIVRFDVDGSREVERVRYAEPRLDEQGQEMPGRVYINKTQYFEGVEPEVWEFQIGGYQVLHKWLKDRRRRVLSYDDVSHYQKIVVALKETIRLMAEIDKVIPAWPIE